VLNPTGPDEQIALRNFAPVYDSGISDQYGLHIIFEVYVVKPVLSVKIKKIDTQECC